MKIAGLDIVFAGKPRIPVEREAVLPGDNPPPPDNGEVVVRHAAVLPISWIAEGVGCEVVLDIEAPEGVAAPVTVSPQRLPTSAKLSLAAQTIVPGDVQDGRCTVRFPLACDELAKAGVDEYFVQWKWVCTVGASTLSLGVSDHLLFVTLAPPIAPWSLDDAGPNPSALALRTACLFGRSQTQDRALVTRLLLALRDLEPGFTRLHYSPDTTEYISLGSSTPQFFDYRKVLTDLWSGSQQPIDLCCIEFVCLLVTLANVMGCTTARAAMQSGSNCATFESSAIHALGDDAPRSFKFCHHEVCVTPGSAFGPDSLAFDAPFLVQLPGVNGDPPALREVDGIPLGLPTSSIGDPVYLPHLVASSAIANMTTFELEPPVLGVPDLAPAAECVQRRTDSLRDELLTVTPPITRAVVRLPGLELFRTEDVVQRGRLQQWSRRRTLFTGAVADDPVVQMDVWSSANQEVLIGFIAEYVASREVTYSRQDINGVPTFFSSSQKATIQLQRGAVVRLLRLADTAPDVFTLAEEGARLE